MFTYLFTNNKHGDDDDVMMMIMLMKMRMIVSMKVTAMRSDAPFDEVMQQL